MFKLQAIVIGIAIGLLADIAAADDSAARRVLGPGEVRSLAAGGISLIDRDLHLAMEGSIEVGLFPALTIAAPLAATLRIVETSDSSGLFLAAGITDGTLTPDLTVLYTPAIVLLGQAVLGPESALRGAIDITSVRQGLEAASFGVWMRAAVGVIVDFGPFLTVAAGVSYQWILDGGGAFEPGLLEAGWVSDSRVSFGAVRSQPYYDLPTLSFHMGRHVDIIGLFRADVDLHRNVNDLRFLAGLTLH